MRSLVAGLFLPYAQKKKKKKRNAEIIEDNPIYGVVESAQIFTQETSKKTNNFVNVTDTLKKWKNRKIKISGLRKRFNNDVNATINFS